MPVRTDETFIMLAAVIFMGLVYMHDQSCQTHCNPMGYSPPGSSVHRIFQARILGWAAISSSRYSWGHMHKIIKLILIIKVITKFKLVLLAA